MTNIRFLTEQKCNILCVLDEVEEVVTSIESCLSSESKIEVEIEDGDTVVRATAQEASMEFYILKMKEAGDSVSRTILGAFNYFKKIETDFEPNKKYALGKISECNASIGILAKPGLVEHLNHQKCIFELAEKFSGLIFNGSGLVDSEGELILDSDGNSSIEK